MKTRSTFLQLVFMSSIIWISCHALVGNATEILKWERLQVAAPALIEQVSRDYTKDIAPDPPVDVGQMRVSKISKPNAETLYLINTRLPGKNPDANPSCGASGCLFYGYIEQNNSFVQVFNGYVNDFQPQNASPIVQVSDRLEHRLPCLRLTSYENNFPQPFVTQLCYNGETYQPVELSK
ncbi:MAG: hypothetical protein CLLPBCKN_007218 [Chroococcidiopsis cubana SAG 39.79]|uniref:Lipoprotein n=1 Tax=Chroococcidiopsis cubana SAG 39.79 TaxID=388085 RepID=A0AB37URP7_9CYAN|nr:hypothetical protein [Chroococcidiopsis cubana]MDZ4877783.1 hypothetical protein [Chroococcidiopsis cubana SAG 39.79]PSB66617.1 hypothetical protein C7B79_00170 [Chroococcidiopsis cubana CCALA 043]PSB66650.1 hypothetical protein C7B79_00335 [Chroococcidiopsis cubana CCALA 043]RUT14063.1 hypothetical protein DSM107010_05460 [Chroococcidiopsis cubana SAG 39.79]